MARIIRRDVKALGTAKSWYEPLMGQYFCELPKSWELWLDEPRLRLKRWDKKRIFWVILKGEDDD